MAQAKQVTKPLPQQALPAAPAVATPPAPPAQFTVHGSKRPLTGMPKKFGTAIVNAAGVVTTTKNANAMLALQAAAKANNGVLTQAAAVAALQAIGHAPSFFGYAKRRGWLGNLAAK
jgi:ethanolamine transporter EutH